MSRAVYRVLQASNAFCGGVFLMTAHYGLGAGCLIVSLALGFIAETRQ